MPVLLFGNIYRYSDDTRLVIDHVVLAPWPHQHQDPQLRRTLFEQGSPPIRIGQLRARVCLDQRGNRFMIVIWLLDQRASRPAMM